MLLILLSVNSFAEKYTTVTEFGNDSNYESLFFKAGDIENDLINNIITFQDLAGKDTFTYIIDKNTVIDDSIFTDIESFVTGSLPWIHIYVLKSEYYNADKTQINVVAVGTTGANVVGIGEKEKNDFKRLKELGIMVGYEDGSLRPLDNITRAEMSKIIATMRGLSKTESNCSFIDVPDNYWAKNYIAVCQGLNIINGIGEGKFAPEEKLTNEEAIKMFVCLLGYESLAQEKGGYPQGYILVANEIGVMKNLELENIHIALRGNIASMACNSLNIPIMEQTIFGENPKYEINQDYTILNQYLLN